MLHGGDSKNRQLKRKGREALRLARATQKYRLGLLLRPLAVMLPQAGALAFAQAQIDPQAYLAHIRYLASTDLKGRATGSPELEKAAAYIAGEFKSFGLKPADGKNYELPFTVTINAHLGPDNHLTVEDAGSKAEFNSGRDFVPFSFSSSGKLSGAVVFAGYG